MRGSPSPQEIGTLTRLFNEGRVSDAEDLSKALTTRFPRHGFGWKVLGALYQAQDRFEDALLATQQAIRLLPGDAAIHNNLGTSLMALDRMDVAEASFRKALALAPNYAKALSNLGSLLRTKGCPEEAEACCRRALALEPNYAKPYGTLAVILRERGAMSEAVACYRAALALEPDNPVAHGNMLFCLSHDLQTETGQLYAEHLAFGERFESPLRATWQPHPNSKDPNRRLQVGFVSGDFFDHAVANFHLPLFEHLAHKPGLALHAYYTHNRNDAISQRLRAYFAHWHDVPQLSEAALAEQIRADGIDILIDLSGHTANNRLLTFARKPAPVQASWLGYLGTTGLQAMDYYLCDRFWLPPGELDWQLTEKPAFLPNAVVFEPSPQAPPVSPLPALTKGHFTFASFNRTNKINPSVIALWSMLLRELPSARMLLAGIPADRQAGLVQSFVQEGIAPERLLLHARSTLRDYLALHQQVDLCLDTYPYGGGATTAHAAWMGVPTLCLAGDTPPSRFGATEMHHLGLDAFIATSIEDFVAKGRYWAEHTSDLAEIRAGLRTRFADSPLGQADAFASHFEAALRAMWARWCQGLPPASV
jgi:predicted O-linked N-acetylglucosamine transferase (SPINDLY family)